MQEDQTTIPEGDNTNEDTKDVREEKEDSANSEKEVRQTDEPVSEETQPSQPPEQDQSTILEDEEQTDQEGSSTNGDGENQGCDNQTKDGESEIAEKKKDEYVSQYHFCCEEQGLNETEYQCQPVPKEMRITRQDGTDEKSYCIVPYTASEKYENRREYEFNRNPGPEYVGFDQSEYCMRNADGEPLPEDAPYFGSRQLPVCEDDEGEDK